MFSNLNVIAAETHRNWPSKEITVECILEVGRHKHFRNYDDHDEDDHITCQVNPVYDPDHDDGVHIDETCEGVGIHL